MIEKRFRVRFVLDKLYYSIMTPIEKISVGRSYMTYGEVVGCLNEQQSIIDEQKIAIDEMITDYKKLEEENKVLLGNLFERQEDFRKAEKEYHQRIMNYQEEIKRLEKMVWKIQWRFQQEVGIEKAKEHYQEIDKEMKE